MISIARTRVHVNSEFWMPIVAVWADVKRLAAVLGAWENGTLSGE